MNVKSVKQKEIKIKIRKFTNKHLLFHIFHNNIFKIKLSYLISKDNRNTRKLFNILNSNVMMLLKKYHQLSVYKKLIY